MTGVAVDAAGTLATHDRGATSRIVFESRRATLAATLRCDARERWAIGCEDAVETLLALLAVLDAGRSAVMLNAPNPRPADAAALGCALLADGVADAALDTRAFHPSAATGTATRIPPHASIELMTSGSTGDPKRVVKSFAQLEAEVGELERAFGASLGTTPFIGTVPHRHLYGLLFRLLWPYLTGRAFHAPQLVTPDQVAAALARHPGAALVTSPALLGRLARWTDFVLTPQVAFSSGSALTESVVGGLASCLTCPLIDVYGSTETGGIGWRLAQVPAERYRPFDGVALSVEPDGEGRPRLSVRSAPTADAWLDTGDAAEVDSDGRFVLLGRVDGVLKIEGKRVSATELERRLAEHPWIVASAVVRLAHRRDELGAAVQLSEVGREALARDGSLNARRELARHLQRWFDPVVVPRRWRWPESLPRTSAGKIALREVESMFAAPEHDDATA